MRVSVLGFGAIGRIVLSRLAGDPDIALSIVLRPGAPTEVREQAGRYGQVLDGLAGLLAHAPDVLVECAGHEALETFGVEALSQGINVVCASVGALSDRELEAGLRAAAISGGGQLHIVSGAIAGLDALSAARGLASVSYCGRKSPSAWKGTAADSLLDLESITQPVNFYSGTAREAARLFPKNANVIAAVALAGVGFEDTEARLWADPDAPGNEHTVHAVGDFGELDVRIVGRTLPDNPKTSALTPESIVRAVRNMVAPFAI